MSWEQTRTTLEQAGFAEDKIREYELGQRLKLRNAGFSESKIDKYFGMVEPDETAIRDTVKANAQKLAQKVRPEKDEGMTQIPEVADNFGEYFLAGFEASSGDMLYDMWKGQSASPEIVAQENPDWYNRLALQIGTISGDFPAMVAGAIIGGKGGGVAGGAAGTVALPVVGTIGGTVTGATIGAGGGAAALPEGIRQLAMQYYEKGEIKSADDFIERLITASWGTFKQFTVGGASLGIGGKVLQSTGKVLSPTLSKGSAVASEIASAAVIARALEGELPRFSDFQDAGILLGGIYGSRYVGKKLTNVYSKTGTKPAEVVEQTKTNLELKEDLFKKGDQGPESLGIKPELKAPEPKAPKNEKTSKLSESEQKVFNRITTKSDKRSPYTMENFRRDYLDKLYPLEKALRETVDDYDGLKTIDNGYKLARMVNDHGAKTKAVLENRMFDFKTGKDTVKGLEPILIPFKKDINGFKTYITSRRVLDAHGRGLKTGVDIDAAKNVIAQGRKRYEAAHKDFVKLHHELARYMKDAEVITPETYKNLTGPKGANYVPLKRISEGGLKRGSTSRAPVKKLKGSESPIQDPILSTIENIDLVFKVSERNRAVKTFVDTILAVEGQTLLKKSKTQMKPTRVDKSEVAKSFKEVGIDPEIAQDFNVFRPMSKTLRANEIEVYRNGKREVYETTELIAAAIKDLDGYQPGQNFVLKLMRAVSTIKRLGITTLPDFIFRNASRDQIMASIFSKGGLRPVVDAPAAIGGLLKKNKDYYEWLKSGGANGAFLDIFETYRNVYSLEKQTGFTSATRNLIHKPWHWLSVFSSTVEQVPRFAEFKRVTKGETDMASLMEGGFASREVTLDFQRMGAKIQAWNSITAFLNAQIQGLDKTRRAFSEKPFEATSRSALLITAPSVLLWWANKDNPIYQALPQSQKDLNWVFIDDDWVESSEAEVEGLGDHLIKRENGKVYRNDATVRKFPKPFELGLIFGTLPERILDAYFKEDPEAFEDFGDTLGSIFGFSAIPDIAQPMAEQWANKTFFMGGDMVPAPLTNVLPEDRYRNYTSEPAKIMAGLIRHIGLGDVGSEAAPLGSPIVVENYIQSWTGTAGRYALSIGDKLLKQTGIVDQPYEDPEGTLADTPILKAFVIRNPSSSAEPINKFWKRYKSHSQVIASMKLALKRNDVDRYEELLTDPKLKVRQFDLSSTKDAISNIRVYRDQLYRLPGISPREKRQLIDQTYYQEIEMSKTALEQIRAYEEALKEEGFLEESEE